ncbi:hypothetical protein PIB30_005149 [Stylosanthes scabra]|uniref:Uncharacterized protein n=1 Tax=Stylosanthes scabra TaxID=79078 RepID=A0ABU6R4Y5_9FABA|nr:hypothetical protein [Stylosanthes scabra]
MPPSLAGDEIVGRVRLSVFQNTAAMSSRSSISSYVCVWFDFIVECCVNALIPKLLHFSGTLSAPPATFLAGIVAGDFETTAGHLHCTQVIKCIWLNSLLQVLCE